MQKHTKIYFGAIYPHFPETPLCECCGNVAVDVHHILSRGRLGSTEKANVIENLMGLCRECHDRYGDINDWLEYLFLTHFKFLQLHDVQFSLEIARPYLQEKNIKKHLKM